MTHLLWIIKNPKDAIIAALAFIGAALYALFKLKSAKLEKANHDNKIKDKKIEITKSQAEFKAEALANEQEEILEEVESYAKKNRNDRANSL